MTASTRDRALDAALVSFASRGYEATSLDDVAGEVGVSKQAVLYYYPSKPALLDAVVDRSAADLSAALEAALAGAGEGWARVEAVVRSVFRLALRRPELLGLLREVSRLGPPSAPRLMAALDPLVQRAREFLEVEMAEWNRARYAEHGLHFNVVQPTSRFGQGRASRPALPVAQSAGQAGQRHRAGEGWDVAVDIRRGSPSFGQWEACVLSAENHRHYWIPEGFAHGFVVLSERATFSYLCTAYYDREADAGLRWNDARLAIDWPLAKPTLSEKDAHAPFLDQVAPGRLPVYEAAAVVAPGLPA